MDYRPNRSIILKLETVACSKCRRLSFVIIFVSFLFPDKCSAVTVRAQYNVPERRLLFVKKMGGGSGFWMLFKSFKLTVE
jgi:uncharacterized membrane protein YsdA (DUF1294 family)